MTSLDGIPGTAGDELGTPPALTLSRVRLGAGGPPGSVRIADGRVVAVGVERDFGGPVLDMDGRTVLPGLWDAHVHAAQWAGTRHRVDLAGLESARAVAETVRLHARDLPADEMVMGQGFRDRLCRMCPTRRCSTPCARTSRLR